MSKIKIGAQVTAKVRHTNVTVSGTFQGYELEDQEDPTSLCGKVFYVKDGMQHLDYVYVDSIKVCKGEDEDEKIRKELLKEIEFITPHDDETDSEGLILPSYHARIDRYKSYLEKQKEQKPESCDCSRDEESYTNGIHHVLMNPEAYGLIKQKPTEWSEDYREEDIRTRFAFYTYKDDPSVLYLSNVFVEETSRNHGFGTRILKAAEKAAEAIGAITICLKVKQDSPANAWYRKRGYGYVAFEDGYDWLEKNLEYLKPAKSAEWSEEEEKKIVELKTFIAQCNGFNKENRTKAFDMIDALRPQPHWKPSEEQMEALLSKLPVVKGSGDKVQDILESLYNDLKKLM